MLLSPTAPFRVVIVGAGFAGTATAVQLLRAWRGGPLHVTLLEREAEPGPGVAFSTPDPRHLLNVVAGGMSALPALPDHFLDWLRSRDPDATAGTFAPRLAYGAYLRELLADTCADAPEGAVVERVGDEAVAVEPGGDAADGAAWTVVTEGGARMAADAVVLAVGVNRPRVPSGVVPELLGHPGWIGDPWDHARLLAAATGAETIAVIGSGLTMIDVAISLADGGGLGGGALAAADAGGAGRGGPRLLALSRRGVLPRAHRSRAPQRLTTFRPPLGPLTADRLAAHVESAALAEVAAGGDWRSAVDGVRPYTQKLWRALPVSEQARFLARHARRWEIHRHRMAPDVAARVAQLRESDRLELRAGALQRVAPVGSDAMARAATSRSETSSGAGAGPIELVYRGDEGVTRVVVDAVVNCTGPDPSPTADPLLSELIAAGRARAGTLGLGLDTDLDGELRDCDGHPSPGLYTLGALRRGQLWESTAVPEIRCQAAELGTLLAARGTAVCAQRAVA
ncbi:FAD-dependent oxidoreductase [Conexibacter sp. JD483]|uniref:FAD/NAD(P)-binding protein n=1 Tax=unclassified Conexibacter TaxID=2627773 RepID=UPI0027219551|nr:MULTISPECIES: FAD/NAD(P)-binding protein [unclassified Conexibacter]MDO8185116.1 FAD-dependent oxidoreductase [Conexibacter sp. CPCC 205706]MDO8196826.1 FAD-dependent oxidoreductase [Conexibacter sp. CPCC 205762]MDR9368602.1 FAD-dependent oxidoreductase [Conexibacter sp. JD483]